MSRLFYWVGLFLGIALSLPSWADTTLFGSMRIGGDNDSIPPGVAITQSVGGPSPVYQPIYPIHFQITEDSTLTQIRLSNVNTTVTSPVLVIWDNNGNQLYRGLATPGSGVFNVSNLNLVAGDYQLFAWGQCLQGRGSEFQRNCNSWDLLTFNDIELIGAVSDDIAFIERQHIGPTNNNDGYTGSSLFPNAGVANPLDLTFTLQTVSNFNRLKMFNVRNPATQAELLLIEPDNTINSIGFIGGEGDFIVENPTLAAKDLAAGTYTLRINERFGRDISWDDIVLDLVSRVSTLPLCEDVFNGPVNATSSDLLYMPPNDGSDGQYQRLTGAGDETLAARDYFYIDGFVQFANDSFRLSNNSATTRMLFNSNFSTFASGGTIVLNDSNLTEHLLIATKANVEIGANTTVNGFIFAEGTISIAPGAVVNGAITAAGQITNNGTVNYRPDAIAKTDFNGMCRNGVTPTQNEFQYGQTALGAVTFEQPFSDVPLVFVMPNLDPGDPDADGPASVRVLNVSETGFSVEQISPPNNFGGVAKPMPNVDYVALLPGVTELPDGQKLYAGSLATSAFQRGQQSGTWQSLDLSAAGFSQTPGVLLQRASFNNNCWLTATGQVSSSDPLTAFDVALEASEVYDVSGVSGTCVPAGTSLDSLTPETVNWLAGPIGASRFTQGSEEIRYEFGVARNHDSGANTLNVSQQCQTLNDLQQDYVTPPLLIANKRGRNGGDGGWARRCNISRSQFGVAVDEDQYRDPERQHFQEQLSYFAITNQSQTVRDGLEWIAEVDALTCEAHSIKLRALKDGRLDTLYTGLVQLSTSSGIGRWGLVNGNGTLSPNPTLDNGLASYQFVSADNGEVELSLFHEQAGLVTILAQNNDNGTSATTDITFRPYGFSIAPVDNSGVGAGQYHYSNKPFSVTLTAIGKDATTGNCGVITAYTGEQTLKFWSSYDAPAVVAGRDVEVNQASIGKNAQNAIEQTIVFNAGVSESINVNYPDAGRILLSARDDVGIGAPPIGEDDEIVQGSQLFTFSPKTLNVRTSSVLGYLRDGTGQTAVNNGVGADAGFIRAALPRAGIDFDTQRDFDTFDLEVEALMDCSDDPNGHCLTNPVTASFYHPLNLSHSVTLPSSANLGVVTLAGNNVTATPYNMQPAEQGVASIKHLAWNEVGQLRLMVAASEYLNDPVAQSATPIALAEHEIGRFYPAYLQAQTALTLPACAVGGFSYLDQQAISLDLTLAAFYQGDAPAKVTNYDTAKGYPTADETNQLWQWSLANSAGELSQGDGSTRLMMDAHSFDWQLGEFTLSALPIGAAKLNPHGVDGPFIKNQPTEALLQLQIIGKDGEKLQQDATTPCIDGGTDVCTVAGLGNLYYGRLVSPSRHGSELASLRVPLAVERFEEGQFMINPDDSCSSVSYNPTALAPIAEFNWAVDSNKDGVLNLGGKESPIPIGTGSSAIDLVNARAVAGQITLQFGAPNQTGRFSYALDLNPSSGANLCWLRFDWDDSGQIANLCGTWQGGYSECYEQMISASGGANTARVDDCPVGEVEFGLFRGNDRIIYRLEVNN
ncbi:H-type lectin domain-containing protein [Motilimonas eburnea]|uniref:H-type lectin domain-containing protein n=1 Tax=Motilimonas eburnea TaxID=1737488 RepID=UPI001E46CA02|nr:H-type lectin domain-containing protein [Motilimonas eburnea]MCE2572121.1 H-type lectin domain-containing protein [Motilimonas eburnea]